MFENKKGLWFSRVIHKTLGGLKKNINQNKQWLSSHKFLFSQKLGEINLYNLIYFLLSQHEISRKKWKLIFAIFVPVLVLKTTKQNCIWETRFCLHFYCVAVQSKHTVTVHYCKILKVKCGLGKSFDSMQKVKSGDQSITLVIQNKYQKNLKSINSDCSK